MEPIRGGLWLSYFGNLRPPFDAPGFEQQWQNPAWPSWRGGVATWQSSVCSYVLIKQHHAASVGTLSLGLMASSGRDQMAPSPGCQVGFIVATREMPHGRRIQRRWRGTGVWAVLAIRNEINAYLVEGFQDIF